MVLQIVLDESGYGQSGPDETFVFAGYAAPVSYWEDFTNRWDRILREPPDLSVDELKRRVRWKHKTDERILRLIEVIRDTGLNGIKFQIPQNDYRLAMKLATTMIGGFPTPKIGWIFDNPYFFGFLALMLHLMAGLRNQTDLKLEIVYDENIRERLKFIEGYTMYLDWIARVHPKLMAILAKDPSPRNDQDFIPLRAADMIAWHVHKDHVERCNGRVHDNALWSALKTIPFFVNEVWTADDWVEVILAGGRH